MTKDTLPTFDLRDHERVVFFTGAGISAESGVPTYRGRSGIWGEYNPDEVACQAAFERDPERVLAFHEQRRALVAGCAPNVAHHVIAQWQQRHAGVTVVTQNTDGLHARAGSTQVIELHGSLWRLRCAQHGAIPDISEGPYRQRQCPQCADHMRPDITWFGDRVDQRAFDRAGDAVAEATLFVAIGTSAVVWPAAGFIDLAVRTGGTMVEINIETTEASSAFAHHLREPASKALPGRFPLPRD